MYFLNIDVFSEDEGDGDVESHKASLYIGWSGGQNIGVFVLSARFALISLRLVITQDDMREAGRVVGELWEKKHYSKHLNCIVYQKIWFNKADHFQALAMDFSLFSNPQSQIPPPAPPRQRSRLWLRSEAVLELQSRKGPEADYTMALITPNPQNI